MKYTCYDHNCEFCYLMRQVPDTGKPILPQEIQNTINQAGGYYDWRVAVIIENSRAYVEIKGASKMTYQRRYNKVRQKVKKILTNEQL